MILSDKTIKKFIEEKKLKIEPLYEDTIRENGVDLRIGYEILRFKKDGNIVFLNRLDNLYKKETGKHFLIAPHEHVLLTTLEYIELPNDIIGLVNLRSTFARLGLFIPPTIVDAGFKGQLTIELVGSEVPIMLDAETRFLHLVFAKTDEPVQRPYSGKYQYQVGVVGAKKDEK
ncbi:putative dCTP deaminase [Sulfolobales Beppu rod-shaped virus 1]|uniref:Putative dCTP deaminase n=1 Tax=Sulfolobales Beppu rod-shaped virus 1 TaxID=2493121 RepID=A0A3Q8Q9F0_9VIRU|nr:putative dCTP deaminase [Sulfolobales Beppu rod-shaped virus 1]AZI75906.1 putative dCTP deaminase [Sulfolobales Beppu rod-shaped virus 1]